MTVLVDMKKITSSSGNVFEDLGIAPGEAASLKIRAGLALQIRAYVEKHKLTQAVVAKRLGITQPKVSAILRGQVDQFTIDYLVKQLEKLGHS